jgi:putative aldouronate transport system substrate-binding protein
MDTKKLSRRDLLKLMGSAMVVTAGGSLLAACKQAGLTVQPTETATVQPTIVPSPTALEQLTLKLAFAGDAPSPDVLNEVLAVAVDRLAGTLNVKFDISFAPWSDMSKLDLILQSGEAIDLIFDAPWWHIQQNIAQGFYEVLDDWLPKYAPNVLKVRPKIMWDANKFNGKIYGIPLGVFCYQGRQSIIRKDIREALGLPKPTNWDEMEALLKAAKEKYPNMIPINYFYFGDYASHFTTQDFDTSPRSTTAPDLDVLYMEGNDGVIRNMFEDPSEKIWSVFQRIRKWFEAGYIPQDVLANGQNYMMNSGKTVVDCQTEFGVPVTHRQAVAAMGGDTEWVTFFDRSKKRITNFLQYNFICLPKVSKNKERSLMFLDWANASKENYDLLAYGIPGKHWEAVGDDMFKVLDASYPWFPYMWIWNPTYERTNAEFGPEAADWNKWTMDATHFEADKITGLTLKNDAVVDQVSQLGALKTQYFYQTSSGVADLEKNWQEYKQKANDLVKVVQAEYQKQVNASLGK